MKNVSVSLIDADFTRRAQAVYALGRFNLHVEPFEDIREFPPRMNGRKIVLVNDQGTAVKDVLHWASITNSTIGVIAYSETPELRKVVDALKAGAFDYIEWPGQTDLIHHSITSCIEEKTVEWEKIERMFAARGLIQSLTPRELQVLENMAKGHSSREIGASLGISPRTVEIHRAHMLSKIRASNSPDAVRIAFEAGLELD